MAATDTTGDMLHVFEWHNGEKEWSPFSDAEMARRQDAMRAHMAANDIDAAVFTSYHGICYYSGFLYCYFGRKYAFVLDQDNATTVSAGIDGGQPWRRTHGDNITYSDWRRDNFFTALQGLVKGAKRVGIEFDHISLDYLTQLKAAFPEVEFVDVAQASMMMRTIKSVEEYAVIREGTRICNVGARACMDAVHAGVREYEVALASTGAMVREIGETFPFVELMDTWTWFQSGYMTDGAHNPVTNKKVARGDILSLNCFPMIFGYYTAIERTLFCEEASDAHLALWEKNCEVMRVGSDLIGPGKRCCDIALELNDLYRSWDLLKYRSFGYGHSFGVLSHYYGREAGVELREDVETVLQPGMVVSMEPMIMIPEGQPGAGGYREHDIFIVTETGAENITNFPYGPEHMIIKAGK
ncbi:MAG: creatininase [Hyphomicrobiales bacterium]|nr:MAG: creatininase [Hyphomicrobiales bacterium]